MKIYSSTDVAKACAMACGKSVGGAWVCSTYKTLHDVEIIGSGKRVKITKEERQLIIAYAMENYRKLGPPSITKWAKKRGYEIPKRNFLSPAKRTENTSLVISRVDEKRLIKLEAKTALLEKELTQLKTKDHKQIESHPCRKNDPLIEEMHKKINAFVFNEPTTIKEVWNYLRRAFELRNNIRVLTCGEQTFPEWLRSNGNLDLFLNELQGFLDAYHDELGRVAQGELRL